MKENKELIIASLAAIGLIISIYMSYKTGEIEYGCILGTSLIIIGSLREYFSNKKRKSKQNLRFDLCQRHLQI